MLSQYPWHGAHGYTGIGYQNCFSTPSLVGTGGSRSWPREQQGRTTPEYSMRWLGKPAPEKGFKDSGHWWQGCGLHITCRGLAVPPLRAAAPQGSNREVSEVFPLGGMGGCFYINSPRGEVQRPSYRKCKPYVGSLAEQTHLYVIHTARQRKWRSTC